MRVGLWGPLYYSYAGTARGTIILLIIFPTPRLQERHLDLQAVFAVMIRVVASGPWGFESVCVCVIHTYVQIHMHILYIYIYII